MPSSSLLSFRTWAWVVNAGLWGSALLSAPLPDSKAGVVPPELTSRAYLPGREDDARVARIAFRLATAGAARCTRLEPTSGLVLQHLSQFKAADRPSILAALALDRGPAIIVAVPGGPAANAGVRPGDIILKIDGAALPPETGLSDRFDAARALARADEIFDLLAVSKPTDVSLMRAGRELRARFTPVFACPSKVHLARSSQRNAYADGRHVFLTTGVLALMRNDDELAFLIAHEMAHNVLGHAAIMRGPTVNKGFGRTLGRSGEIIRETESAADALGAELMLDGGFDPVRGCAVLTRLGGSDLGIALLATHEPAGKRIAAIKAVARTRAAQ